MGSGKGKEINEVGGNSGGRKMEAHKKNGGSMKTKVKSNTNEQ